MDDLRTLYDEIHTLLAAEATQRVPSRAHVERTLTDGYAHAHALEAERWRLERRLGALAGDATADVGEKTQELAVLANGIARTSDELTRLRTLLTKLRDRAAAAAA